MRFGRLQAGFSYLIAMFLVAALAVIALRALRVTVTQEQREKEAQLLDVGIEYRRAIRDYYEGSPGTEKQYPRNLQSLLFDERTTTIRRYLRKVYRDPITGNAEWGIVRANDGGIMGIHSLSNKAPIKQSGFPSELHIKDHAATYEEWVFSYQPELEVNPTWAAK